VTVLADAVTERAETFTLKLSDATGAGIVSSTGAGRIIDQSVASFFTLTPCRLFDSRDPSRPLYAMDTVLVQAAGKCGVPPGALAVALNVTTTQPTTPGHLRVFGDGAPASGTSTMNFLAGQTRGNNAVVPLGPEGLLNVSLGQTLGATHVILDVAGYFH